MSKYDVRKILLYLGISTAIFLFSCILVGYGAYVSLHLHLHQIGYHPIPLFSVVEFVSELLGIHYFQAMYLLWFIGVVGMVAGLIGILDVIKALIIPIIYRRKHSM